jgi:hypothetical protein
MSNGYERLEGAEDSDSALSFLASALPPHPQPGDEICPKQASLLSITMEGSIL